MLVFLRLFLALILRINWGFATISWMNWTKNTGDDNEMVDPVVNTQNVLLEIVDKIAEYC